MLTYWCIPVVLSCSLFWMLLLLLRLCVFNAQLNAGHYCVPSPQSKCGKCDCLHSNVIQMFSILGRMWCTSTLSSLTQVLFLLPQLDEARKPTSHNTNSQCVSLCLGFWTVSSNCSFIPTQFNVDEAWNQPENDPSCSPRSCAFPVELPDILLPNVPSRHYRIFSSDLWLLTVFKVRQQKSTDQKQANMPSCERWSPTESRRLLDI